MAQYGTGEGTSVATRVVAPGQTDSDLQLSAGVHLQSRLLPAPIALIVPRFNFAPPIWLRSAKIEIPMQQFVQASAGASVWRRSRPPNVLVLGLARIDL